MMLPPKHGWNWLSGVALVGSLLATGTVRGQSPAPASVKAEEFFEKSIRSLLVEKCQGCHGAKSAKGGLRLDSREAMLAGGSDGVVVVPGKPAESRLLRAVRHIGELKMPPDGKLPAADADSLEKWISDGAFWPAKAVVAAPDKIDSHSASHWAFQPIRRPAVPDGPGMPIDRFVRQKLAGKKLSLAPEADRKTLIRRLTYDLHGLPPTPAEVAAFQADTSPEAYAKVVDRLLASPRYGERWGRRWLDVARYADNKGYVFFEEQNYPWAWTYRDYVIDALNRDVPYDRFLMEQLAADRLDVKDSKTLAALGFLTVGGHFMGNTHDMIDDRIDTVTRGLMGLTVSCARCHDHKFDPVPTADYYSLYGMFRSSVEPMIPPLWGPTPDTAAYKIFAWKLAGKESALMDFVRGKHRELVTQARERASDYLLAAHAIRNQPPADDFMLIADKGDLNPTMIARWRAFLEATRKKNDPAWALWHRFADLPDEEFQARAWTIRPVATDNPLVRAAFETVPKSMRDVAGRYGQLLTRIEQQWVAVGSNAALPDPAAEALRAAFHGPASPADAPLALDWGFLSLFPDRATQAEYQKLIKAVETHAATGPPRSMILTDAEHPYEARVFLRGQPNRLGGAVPRQFLKVVDSKRTPVEKGSGRLELARSVASASNPLTARVQVNRLWMHHFGRGLVNTPGDFGLRGDPPTHPELLDWLASEFMANGWSQKKLHREILLSATYRQISDDRPDCFVVDPENRLLWKQNRTRLDFESLHDGMLAVAGQLDGTVGGPSFPLFTGQKRRAVYGFINRLEFPSLLSTFDVPSPAATSSERTSTTVSPQALYLMNGPFARDAAKAWLKTSPVVAAKTPSEKLDALYLGAFGRKPVESERARLLAFVARGPEADRWTDLAHGLLLTNEFLFVD